MALLPPPTEEQLREWEKYGCVRCPECKFNAMLDYARFDVWVLYQCSYCNLKIRVDGDTVVTEEEYKEYWQKFHARQLKSIMRD